jgi:hypothetical protein
MPDTNQNDGNNTQSSGDTEPKTYTQDELNKMLQSETDKRVTEALKTSKEKWQQEYEKKIEAEKKEAVRLATLSAEEKRIEEQKQYQIKLEEREKEVKLRELKLDTIALLQEESLPVQFSEFLIGQDAELTNENIKQFKKHFSEAVESAVNERIKGKTPSSGSTSFAEKKLADMTSQERIELRKSNPELYKNLLAKRQL